jgi:hypothetical protein
MEDKISDTLLKYINEQGELVLPRYLTIQLLSWIDNVETHLPKLRATVKNIKNLVEIPP